MGESYRPPLSPPKAGRTSLSASWVSTIWHSCDYFPLVSGSSTNLVFKTTIRTVKSVFISFHPCAKKIRDIRAIRVQKNYPHGKIRVHQCAIRVPKNIRESDITSRWSVGLRQISCSKHTHPHGKNPCPSVSICGRINNVILRTVKSVFIRVPKNIR